MRRTIAPFIATISVGLLCGLCSAWAQDESKKEAAAPTAKAQPVQPYRLEFAFNELADGKIVNTRHYSMILTAGESNEIKIGTRVPVVTGTNPNVSGASQWQYVDVGTNIWAQLREHSDEWALVVRSEVSNVDTSSDSEHVGGSNPVIRQIKLSGSTLLVVGKPILIGSMDDPNSKRQFQLEVTATKLALSKESACTFYDRSNNGFEGKCGTKKGDALNAYCTIDANKSSGQTQEGKEGKKLYQLQVGCLGV